MKSITTALSDSKGVSLIEMMISLAILLIVSLALMQSAMVGMNTNSQNAVRDEAVSVAEAQIDKLRSQAFANIASFATTVVTRNIRAFKIDYSTKGDVVAIGTDKKQITVTVNWNYRGKAYSHAITTMVRKES